MRTVSTRSSFFFLQTGSFRVILYRKDADIKHEMEQIMRYYILPGDSGVAITNGEYLELHNLADEGDYILHGATDAHEGLVDFINSYSRDNTHGDVVFDDIVPENAPFFEGTPLPNTIFYRLAPYSLRPEGWMRILPTLSNPRTKVDTLTEEEISELEDQAILAEIDAILDREYEKPLEERDNDLIDECWKTYSEITGVKTEFSPEEIDERVKEIITRAKNLSDEELKELMSIIPSDTEEIRNT